VMLSGGRRKEKRKKEKVSGRGEKKRKERKREIVGHMARGFPFILKLLLPVITSGSLFLITLSFNYGKIAPLVLVVCHNYFLLLMV